ncbi:unnamed protein product, partial [Onchocerca ochengi]|uniref:Protein of unassigned function n=1 Tax=Onchocerca ochengi TaxID=42157 RepID=A0A182EZE9_ONCOC
MAQIHAEKAAKRSAAKLEGARLRASAVVFSFKSARFEQNERDRLSGYKTSTR